MSTPGWVDAALREHEEQAARDAGAGPLQPHPRDERNPGAPQPAPGRCVASMAWTGQPDPRDGGPPGHSAMLVKIFLREGVRT